MREEKMEDNSALYHFARWLDRLVNIIALVLFLLILLYAGHSLWYSHSLQNDSFLPDELAKYRPDGQKPSLNDLKKINDDVIAWITIDDTNIDYPVVQGEDNSEYLNKSILDEFTLSGTLFLDADNKRDFSDPYNMVHGHHVQGGAMLADVVEFRNASFFNKHTKGTLWYPDAGGKARADRIELFASLETDAGDEIVYAEPSRIRPGVLTGVTDYINEKATQKRKVDINDKSRVIGLSTCENGTSFERVLLFGKLVPMTDQEILAAQKKLREKTEEEEKAKGLSGLISNIPPWILPSAGALLIILLAYIIWRKYRQRQESKERENEQ